jgi:hypothetical protein
MVEHLRCLWRSGNLTSLPLVPQLHKFGLSDRDRRDIFRPGLQHVFQAWDFTEECGWHGGISRRSAVVQDRHVDDPLPDRLVLEFVA